MPTAMRAQKPEPCRATATGSAPCRPRPGTWSWRSRSCGRLVLPVRLERCRRLDQALFAVVMEEHANRTCARKVDDLVRVLGGNTGIVKAELSRVCVPWTPRWPRSPTGSCPRPRSRACPSVPPTTRPVSAEARAPASPLKLSSWPRKSAGTAAGRCLGSRSATVRTAPLDRVPALA